MARGNPWAWAWAWRSAESRCTDEALREHGVSRSPGSCITRNVPRSRLGTELQFGPETPSKRPRRSAGCHLPKYKHSVETFPAIRLRRRAIAIKVWEIRVQGACFPEATGPMPGPSGASAEAGARRDERFPLPMAMQRETRAMAEQKDSSVLFSLKELMNLEEDRIRREEEDKRRKADMAERARLDAEHKAREDEERRIQAEENRRRQEEQRQREETARLEAIRQAEVEKARLEAENAARMEALRQQQEHERHIAALAQDKGKKNLKLAAGGFAAFFVIAVVGGGIAYKNQLDEKARIEAQHEQEIQEQQGRMAELQRRIEEQTNAISAAERQLAEAKDDRERAAAQLKLQEVQRQRAATQSNLRRVQSGGGGGSAPRGGGTKCTPGDPLCSDLN